MIFVQLINVIRVLRSGKITERDSKLFDGRGLGASVPWAWAAGWPVKNGASEEGGSEVGQ